MGRGFLGFRPIPAGFLWVGLLLWAVAGPGGVSQVQARDIYQCQSGTGFTEFSDQPCGAGARVIRLPEPVTDGVRLDQGIDEALLQRLERSTAKPRVLREYRSAPSPDPLAACPPDSRLQELARHGEVSLCMTPAMVYRATSVGAEPEILSWLDAEGHWERWRFRVRRDDWPYSLVFRNGRVVRLSDHFDPYDGQYLPPGRLNPGSGGAGSGRGPG